MTTRDDWTERFQQRFKNRETALHAPKAHPTPKPLKLTPCEPPEGDVLASVLEFLQLHPQVGRVWRQNTGAGRFVYPDGRFSQFMRFGFPGCPDLIGYMRGGRALYVETKALHGRKKPDQVAFIEAALLDGCVAFFASSVSEAVDALREFGYSRMT